MKIKDILFCPQIFMEFITLDNKQRGLRDRQGELLDDIYTFMNEQILPGIPKATMDIKWDTGILKGYNYSDATWAKFLEKAQKETFDYLLMQEADQRFGRLKLASVSWMGNFRDPEVVSEHLAKHPLDKVFLINVKNDSYPINNNYFDTISFYKSIDLDGGRIDRAIQDSWIQMFKKYHLKCKGIESGLGMSGCITNTFIDEWTRYIGRYIPHEEVGEQIRGVYWATIIGNKQMAKLGGAEEVKRSDVFHTIEEMECDGEIHYYLQLTEMLEDCTLEDIKRLYRFLKSKAATAVLPNDNKMYDHPFNRKQTYILQMMEGEA